MDGPPEQVWTFRNREKSYVLLPGFETCILQPVVHSVPITLSRIPSMMYGTDVYLRELYYSYPFNILFT